MTPALGATLAAVAARLADAADPWWIITGAAAALHGAEIAVRDVDVLTSPADARRLLGAAAAPGRPSAHYRSAVFGRLGAGPLPVEIMADFACRVAGVWRPVRFATRETIVLEGVPMPVPSRAELAALLAVLGRPKDLARRALLTS